MIGYELQWSILWEPQYRKWILDGIYLTYQIALVSWGLALLIGILVGVLAESPARIPRYASTSYVELFRNVPLLVQLFFAYFVIPLILPTDLRRQLYAIGWELGSSVLTLSLYTGAKVAEHVRAGLNTVSPGVRQAALASGLSWWQMEQHVVVPLLLRIIVPSLTTEFLTIFKSSSLAMAVGVVETTYVTQRIGFHTFRWVEANTVGTLVYLFTAWIVAWAMALVERFARVPGLIRRHG